MTTRGDPSTLVSSTVEIPFWRDERVLRIGAQVFSAILVIGFILWSLSNVLTAAEQRGLSLGFGFLNESAGFPIGETVIPYNPSNTFLYAFLAGVLATLWVSVLGIFFATLLGTLIGIARLSTNWLVNRLALVYIEIHRNIPLLVLLFLWYRGVFTTQLPSVQESLALPGPIYISQRGLYAAWPRLTEQGGIFVLFILAGLLLAFAAFVLMRRITTLKNSPGRRAGVAGLIVLVFAVAGWLVAGASPLRLDTPVLEGFNFSGGLHISPEFAALLIGLVTYTAAFIAEVVRAGIQAISRGQIDAARALGLRYGQVLSLVILPQAMRVIIPPLISQYLNLIKNSSLAFFIGYPELFFIGKTTTNQAGRAVQVILLVMGVYLVISLVTSLLLNWYNRRIQLVER